jgi:hypothetical protein
MKAAPLLLAMIVAAHAYAHDVARAVFSDRNTLERFIAATDVTAERISLKKSPDGTMAGDPGQLSTYTRGESIAVPQTTAQELRTPLHRRVVFLMAFRAEGRSEASQSV